MGMQIGQVVFGQSLESINHRLGCSYNSTAILSASRSYRRDNHRADGTEEKSDTTQIKRNQKQSGVNRRLL